MAATGSELPLIEVSGDARERGRQYGEAARTQISTAVGYYSESFARTANLTWDKVQERAPLWVPVIEAYLPGIGEEVHGIAEGSGFTFAEILALNGRGELTAGNPFGDDSRDGCSSYSITAEASGDGHAYAGQNWDWKAGVTDTVVMLRVVQPNKPTLVMQVEAGQVGRHGVNSVGIALNANGLGVKFGKNLSIPQPFIRRRILDSWDMHDALEAVFLSKQALCTNLLLSHRDGFVIDLETTPGRHGMMYPTDGILVHANHFQAFIPPQVEETWRPFSPDSLFRTQRIERVLRRAKSAQSSEQMRELIGEALRDHFSYPNSVCNHPDPRRHPHVQTQTIASSIVDLTTGDYYLAHGVPCENTYEKLPWNVLDGPELPAMHRPRVSVPATLPR